MTSRAWIDRDRQVLFIGGPISGAHTSTALKFVLQLQGEGTVVVSSTGGDVCEAFALYDILWAYRDRLTSVALGQVQSAAVLPFMACDRRLAGYDVRFMYHHGTYQTTDPEQQREMVGITKELVAQDERYIEIIAGRSGVAKKLVRKRTRFGHYFGAKAAVADGFATGVFLKLELDPPEPTEGA